MRGGNPLVTEVYRGMTYHGRQGSEQKAVAVTIAVGTRRIPGTVR